MKLELKHLAPYLPYRLKVSVSKDVCIYKTVTLKDVTLVDYRRNALLIVKPILRPLSDLTNGEMINGKKFGVGIIKTSDNEPIFSLWNHKCTVEGLPYSIIQELFKAHYDVFGLIPAGLALKK